MALFEEEKLDSLNIKDRRKRLTPGLSRFSFFGRRKAFRRKTDNPKGGYVDRYSSLLFFFLILMIGLNVLDAFLTLIILDLKGWEANPVVRSVIETYRDKFWILKLSIVSTSLILLCIHSRFKMVREIIIALSSLYLIVIVYQVFLILHL